MSEWRCEWFKWFTLDLNGGLSGSSDVHKVLVTV